MRKIKNFLNRLNGWQRLYAVLVFFIYIPMCFLSVCDISVGKVDTFKLLESSKELQEIWKNSGISINGISFMDIISEKFPEINRKISEKQKALKYIKELEEQKEEKGLILDKDDYEFWIGGYVYKMSIPINFKGDKKTRSYYKKIYKNAIESKYRNQLSKEIIVLICMQIIAAFVFYTFFYSIGWIYKGFKRYA